MCLNNFLCFGAEGQIGEENVALIAEEQASEGEVDT